MGDTVELSEAIRSILGEENKGKQLDRLRDVESRSEEHAKSSILRNESWDPYHAPGKVGIYDKLKRQSMSKPDFRSPPKKQRHINKVNILRNPHRKNKPSPDATRIGDLLKKKTDTPKCNEILNSRHTTEHSPVWSSQNSQSSSVESLELSQKQNPAQPGPKSMKAETYSDVGVNVGSNKERGTLSQQMHLGTGRRKRADDSLTNITWLRRMTAPDMDPETLQVKVSDPRHERPPYSYSTLIQFAISTAPSGRMTLREIYHWIEVHFPYFRTAKLGWRNSIRHNLSLHKIFIREPPVGHGAPAFWTLRPGTVVRLPEKTMFVAKNKSNAQDSSSITESRHQPPKSKSTHKRSSVHGDERKRKEQYILPRPTSQPLALVPVPIFLSTETGAQLITSPATGEPILSPIPINLLPDAHLKSLFPAAHEKHEQKKMVRIAPKVEIVERASNNNLNMQVSYPNATFSNSSALRDSGFSTDGEGTFCENESAVASGLQGLFGASPENRKHLPIKKRGSPWNGMTSSTPHQNSKRAEHIRPQNDMPDFSIFDELPSFDSTPNKTPSRRGKRKMTTPSRVAPCPDWLSPIRGLTPFKFGDEFTNLREDLNVTPPRTGLTPKNKFGQASTPTALCTPKRSHRSPALGSLGDLGLSGLTPERISDIQNQSFGKMFGGDLSFEMDSDGFWSMMSPS